MHQHLIYRQAFNMNCALFSCQHLYSKKEEDSELLMYKKNKAALDKLESKHKTKI